MVQAVLGRLKKVGQHSQLSFKRLPFYTGVMFSVIWEDEWFRI